MSNGGKNTTTQAMQVTVDKAPKAVVTGQGDWPLVALGVVILTVGIIGVLYAVFAGRGQTSGEPDSPRPSKKREQESE